MSEFIFNRGESTEITFNGDEGDYPDITIGEENDFQFYIIGSAGGESAKERYNQVKEFQKFAGYAEVTQTLNGAYYTEPETFVVGDAVFASIASLLVSIEPQNVDKAKSVWGVVESVDDNTEIFNAVARVDMSVFVLAEYDDFADRSAVKAEYKADF